MKEKQGTPGQRKRAAELIWLARTEFGELLEGEVKMLRGAALGLVVDLADQPDDEKLFWDKEKQGGSEWGCWESWGEHRKVRAVVLRWMCSIVVAKALVDPSGFWLENALILGYISLDGVQVPFHVVLLFCAIPDDFSAKQAEFHSLILSGSWISRITADGMKVDGAVFLRDGFRATGEVRIVGATVVDNFECSDGFFEGSKGTALNASGMKVGGDVYLRGDFRALGKIQLIGAKIEGALECIGGEWMCDVSFYRCSVEGTFFFHPKRKPNKIILDGMRVRSMRDDLKKWPKHLSMPDFVYESIEPKALGSLARRKVWLRRHDRTQSNSRSPNLRNERFNPQPYRQFAKVLRHSGHAQFADEIMFVASQKQAAAQLQRLKVNGKYWLDIVFVAWYWLLEHVIGYGYRRWLPLVWMLGFFFVGALVFSDGDPKDLVWFTSDPYPGGMQPTQARAAADAVEGMEWLEGYPVFRPISYSMDTFLPLVNLHQESYWTPKDGWVKRFYLPFHILSGWVVTTLAAVSVTGLVRHEKE